VCYIFLSAFIERSGRSSAAKKKVSASFKIVTTFIAKNNNSLQPGRGV